MRYSAPDVRTASCIILRNIFRPLNEIEEIIFGPWNADTVTLMDAAFQMIRIPFLIFFDITLKFDVSNLIK